VRKGYFEDPFAEEFVKFRGKRDVIMHRGYWARLYLFKHILDKFLVEGIEDVATSAKTLELQVLSLGCGLDTSYFNERNNEKEKLSYRYIEIDLPIVCEKKVFEAADADPKDPEVREDQSAAQQGRRHPCLRATNRAERRALHAHTLRPVRPRRLPTDDRALSHRREVPPVAT